MRDMAVSTRFYCLWACLFTLLPRVVFSETPLGIDTTPAQFTITYESIKLPADENMGLVGGTFFYETNDWLSLGISTYGAVSGERGGFITLGGAAELKKQLADLVELKAGLFVGAGGGRGGYTLQGGGLMLRYHLGGQLKSDQWGNFGAGISYVDFPDGTIHSLQPYISYNYPFRTLLPSGWFNQPAQSGSRRVGTEKAEQEFTLVYRSYIIPSEVVTDSGQPQNDHIGLMGVEWSRYLDDIFFFKLESEGAMQGESNGYMQIFAGAGYRYPLTTGSWLKFSASAGFAGGGSVDTGGGLLLDGQMSLRQKLTKHLFAELAGGYVYAPDASFKATSMAVKLGYHFHTPNVSPNRKHVPLSDLSSFKTRKLRIRMAQQTYMQNAENWRNHHPDQDVSLLGLQLDYFKSNNFFVTGQGIAAYNGMAGGYMTGLVGAGLHFPLFNTPLFFETEALVGAAGGGGLDVAGGFVWQINTGLGYQISDTLSIMGSYGYMSAPRGNFRAKTATISLVYHFSLFTN